MNEKNHLGRYLDHLGLQDGKNQTSFGSPLKSKIQHHPISIQMSHISLTHQSHHSCHGWPHHNVQLMQFVGFSTTFGNRRTDLNVSMANWLFTTRSTLLFHYELRWCVTFNLFLDDGGLCWERKNSNDKLTVTHYHSGIAVKKKKKKKCC